MKLDILAFAAHPDDVELSCGGTLIKQAALGHRTGIVDLTTGQLGSRGTPELRVQEARQAGEFLGLSVRDNLGMEDGWFRADRQHIESLIAPIRRYRPDIVLVNAPSDRHPDHGRGAELALEACFFSGLQKIETQAEEGLLEPWRPRLVLHYIQDRYHSPDVIIDITDQWPQKMKAILAFRSQFYDPESSEPETPISSKAFLDFLESRAREFGRLIGAEYGEGFISTRTPGVNDLSALR